MIKLKTKYEAEAFSPDCISFGKIMSGDKNSPIFRGVYFKVILPWKREKEYMDIATFRTKSGLCQHVYIFQLVKISNLWKNLTFLKANIWAPTNET